MFFKPKHVIRVYSRYSMTKNFNPNQSHPQRKNFMVLLLGCCFAGNIPAFYPQKKQNPCHAPHTIKNPFSIYFLRHCDATWHGRDFFAAQFWRTRTQIKRKRRVTGFASTTLTKHVRNRTFGLDVGFAAFDGFTFVHGGFTFANTDFHLDTALGREVQAEGDKRKTFLLLLGL